MFSNKKRGPNPMGVSLGELFAILAKTSIKATLNENTLLARHDNYTVCLDVVPPDVRESENGPIRAVVRVVTVLPSPVHEGLFEGQESSATTAFNRFAALGALYTHDNDVQIGSRLTIYEGEDAWKSLHLPLLVLTTVFGAEAILGGIRRTLMSEDAVGGDSKWTSRDFEQVESYLSRVCACTTGELGLTVEFGLGDGAISAARGDHKTALFQMMADQPHPELGGGLFCLLQMPHQIRDKKRLDRICLQLNKMEMAADDLPPHFGAWCPGRLGDNPAYVTFLPNALHSVQGIAANVSFWAMNRAQWANAMLAALGERA